MAAKDYPSIPLPQDSVVSLRNSAVALKESTELLTGQRGTVLTTAVTWGDLLRLGIIKPDQLPVPLPGVT